MPTISDPGYRLVAAAAEAGAPIRVLPGPSAVTAALAVSGLPTDRFCFEGFPPAEGRRAGPPLRRAGRRAPDLVFFEAAKRIQATLGELAAAFGPGRRAVVCRELTKTHEEVRRGTLGELAEWAAGGTLGEITLVVQGNQGGPRLTRRRRRPRWPAGPGRRASQRGNRRGGPGVWPAPARTYDAVLGGPPFRSRGAA